MQYDAETPDAYLKALEDDWRKQTLLQLRKVIRKAAPEIEECIHYKMLGFRIGEDFVFHLNAQRNYVSLYVGDASRIDPDGMLLKGLSVGKGCVRFAKSKAVEQTRISDFIQKALAMKAGGEQFGC
ncbi:iron chaperone [Roseibium sp.]|uniref:iron chaperone n=1 Tax=Roseibium sp. TaxID=1936156 RepID=UPI003BB21BFE